MEKLKDLSIKVTKALDSLLPKEVRCVVILVDTVEQDVCTVSDMAEQDVKAILKDSLDVIDNPDESDTIKNMVN